MLSGKIVCAFANKNINILYVSVIEYSRTYHSFKKK